MKITLIRKDEEQGTEALSLCDTDAFFEKVKTENKAGHISELREILPRLAGSSARYVHIDKLPRVYPAVEYTRKQNGRETHETLQRTSAAGSEPAGRPV